MLAREQWLVGLLSILIPFVVVSGLVTWPFSHGEWYWLQSFYIAHATLSVIAALVTVPYLAVHFFRTFGNRVFPVFFSGLLAGAITLIAVASGLWLVFRGQTEQARWILSLHVYASLAVCLLAVDHVIRHVRRARTRRRKSGGYLPSFSGTRARTVLVAFVVQVGLVLSIWGMSHALNTDSMTMAAPSDYGFPYGPNALAPSETEVADAELIRPGVLGRSGDCARCHADLHEQWRSSVHSRAALDPAYERNVTLLAEKKGIEATRYCEGCHAPVALLSGRLMEGGAHAGIDGTVANDQGVDCVTCHIVDDVIHVKGVASYRVSVPEPYLFEFTEFTGLDWINDWVIRMRPELHRTNFDTSRIQGPEFCATCHSQYMDERMNHWGWVQMQDQYSSWLESPYSGRSGKSFSSSRERTCRQCHMEPVMANDPSSSADGKVMNHWVPGANTFVPTETGDPRHLERVRQFLMADKLRIAVHLDDNQFVERAERFVDEELRQGGELPDYYYLGQSVKGDILVSNVGVGHKFPAGTNDIHEAWLAVRVSDAMNRTIHERGQLKADGTLDSRSHVYRSIKVDRHGKHVWKHDLFNMVGEQYSNVIPSGETDVVPIEFSIPYWAVSPVTISVQLKYRKFNKRYGAWVMQDETYQAPITVVASDTTQIGILERSSIGSEESGVTGGS